MIRMARGDVQRQATVPASAILAHFQVTEPTPPPVYFRPRTSLIPVVQ